MMPQQEISDIPHSSQIGTPRAPKNSNTSGAMGAAPDTVKRTSSRPSSCRTAVLWSSGRAPGSVTPLASRAALIFSQTRGTPPHAVGRTSGSAATTAFGSAT